MVANFFTRLQCSKKDGKVTFSANADGNKFFLIIQMNFNGTRFKNFYWTFLGGAEKKTWLGLYNFG